MHGKSDQTDEIILSSLFILLSNQRTLISSLEEILEAIKQEKHTIAPGCVTCAAPCENGKDYDMRKLWAEKEETRAIKLALIRELEWIALQLYPLRKAVEIKEEIMVFLYKVLFILAEDWEEQQLLPLLRESAKAQEACREILAQFYKG